MPPGATAPATKWYLRVNLRGSPPVYLNVQLDPMKKRTTIIHEAAVRAGEMFHSFYMLFVRTEAGEVGSLVADRRDSPGGQAAAGRSGGERARYLAGCNRHSQHGQVPKSRMEKRGEDRRQERMLDQWTVAWEAEGQRGHQGSGLDVRGVREDRPVQEGHSHEGDV